jgi:hypothetical protein
MLSPDELLRRTDELLAEEDLSTDEQKQLFTAKSYLLAETRARTEVGQKALACAKVIIDLVQLSVYRRRLGEELRRPPRAKTKTP